MLCIGWGWSEDPGPSPAGMFPAILLSMELVRLKIEASSVSASELEFFGNIRDLKKNYLKPILKKEWV